MKGGERGKMREIGAFNPDFLPEPSQELAGVVVRVESKVTHWICYFDVRLQAYAWQLFEE